MEQPHAHAGQSPWVHGGLRLARAALDAVEAEAILGYARDEEVCGYLRGPADDALLCDEAVAMENLAARLHARDPARFFRSARTYFELPTLRFEKAIVASLDEGRPVKVLYHSHLDAGAYFSPTDAAAMSMGEMPAVEGGPIVMGPGPAWPLAFLVTSVMRGEVAAHQLFVWDVQASTFAPSSFTLVDAPATASA